MEFKIGFCSETPTLKNEKSEPASASIEEPKKSLVKVQFENTGINLTYYNDLFDLKIGDTVFVDGQYKGKRGVVTSVSYSFKIKPSQYKRVLARCDTSISGELFFSSDHFLAFDKAVIPSKKIEQWFFPPEEEEYVSGYDSKAFSLASQTTLDATPSVTERGFGYFLGGNVAYLSLDDIKGVAVVLGENPYKVEFTYYEGEISRLTCTCPYADTCKHMVASSFLLDELLDEIDLAFSDQIKKNEYFAAIDKNLLYKMAIKNKPSGKIVF